MLVCFFDGLVIFCCGCDESCLLCLLEKCIINNIVLKKLWVVFELKDVDMYVIFVVVGLLVFKLELSVLFC